VYPELFEIAGQKIHSYGFFIALGYVCALLLGRWLAKSRGLDPAPFMDLAFIAIVSGVIGARLFYVITAPSEFIDRPGAIFDFWNGGLVFYGGFLLATGACFAYGLYRRMPVGLSCDIVLTGVAFAHAFGRIGCFAAGCCHGSACSLPWGMVNPSGFVAPSLKGVPLHPVQLYESFLLFALTGLLVWLIRGRKLRDGNAGLLYLTGYAAIRFVLEMFRADEDRGTVLGGWLSTSQGVALFLFALGAALFLFGVRRQHAERRNL
jgi:phosphatidylglycerol:prolipoprotein diacylglycerol transferase